MTGTFIYFRTSPVGAECKTLDFTSAETSGNNERPSFQTVQREIDNKSFTKYYYYNIYRAIVKILLFERNDLYSIKIRNQILDNDSNIIQ